MHYLIDGHNLIAKMPGISLDDPDDEAKLILRLKRWAAAGTRRRITVIFVGGLPGGKALKLSGGSVSVLFASPGQTADALLIARIKRAKNPAEYTLVSSDRQIVAVAKDRRMPHLRSEKFAAELGPGETQALPAAPPATASPTPLKEETRLSESEIAAWLELFPEPEPPPKVKKAAKPPAKRPPQPAEPPPSRQPPSAAERSNRQLTPEEVDEWLKLFGHDEKSDADDG
jgi:hypothetical protein